MLDSASAQANSPIVLLYPDSTIVFPTEYLFGLTAVRLSKDHIWNFVVRSNGC
jgi:hypothetical protein